jgi:hypothetical protein
LTLRLTAPRVSRLALETPSMSGKQDAMRVHLKGVHSVKMRLVDGRLAVYHYAWRGGPRLLGEPGSAEFLKSFNDAHAARRKPVHGCLLPNI